MPGIWSKFFGLKKEPAQTERAEMLSGGSATFTAFNGNAYENDIYRTAVDSIARNAAKLKITHVVNSAKSGTGDDELNRILQVRPNPYMSAYDLIYKIVTHYFLHNNAFAYLQKDERGSLTAIYPLSPKNVEYITDTNNNLYCRFLFENGQIVTLPYSEVFIMRRFFNSNDLLGDNNTAILPALDLAHAQSEGMEHSIKASASIRGLLKYNQVLSAENLKKEKEAFVNDYLGVANTGGIAAIDSKFDYIPLETKEANINGEQLEAVKKKIYEYLGISENIVNSTYSEDEWGAFYESVLEAIAVQFSLELTEKLFTRTEQLYGNSIILEANRLQFASVSSKTNIIKELMPLGLLTVNQALEILNLSPVDDGDRRLQTLNVVNAAIVDQYQLNRKGAKPNERDPNSEH